MRRFCLLLMLLQISALCADPPRQLTASLLIEKTEYVLGEPVTLLGSLRNDTSESLLVWCDLSFTDTPCVLHVVGPTRNGCAESKGRYEIGGLHSPPPLEPGHEITLRPLIGSDLGIVDPGEYEVWLEYDAKTLGAKALKELLTPIRSESNHVRLRLNQPSGLDATIFHSYHNACNQITLAPDSILSKYPTSTYAGYALLSQGQCIPDPRVFLTDVLSMDKHAQIEPQSANQMAGDKRRSLDGDQERVAQLEAYLKARPDFAQADCLKVELAGRLAALQRYSESKALCNEVVSNRPESGESKKAKMLVDFLTQRGYLKPGK